MRSYNASRPDEHGMKDGDTIIFIDKMNTLDHLLILTNRGNMIYRPIHEITELKWKDVGEHISQTITNLSMDEEIIAAFPYKEIDANKLFIFISKDGMIKQTRMTEFSPWRTYRSRPTTAMKMKSDTDQIVSVFLTSDILNVDVLIASHRAFGLRYPLDEVPVVGSKAAGVKAINLKDGDYVVAGSLVPSEGDSPILLLSQRGAAKRMLAQELPQLGRAKRGLMIFRELKKNPHRLAYMTTDTEGTLVLTTQNGTEKELDITKVPISDRISNGSFVIDEKKDGELFSVFQEQNLIQE